MNPVTGQFLGPNTDARDRRARPEHGQHDQRAVPVRPGHHRDRLRLADDRAARRASARPTTSPASSRSWCAAAAACSSIGRAATRCSRRSSIRRRSRTSRSATAQLQSLGTGGLTTTTPPALNVYEYDATLPSSFQWNGGVQMALPWAIALDVSYVGQHGYNIVQTGQPQRGGLRRGVPAARTRIRTLTPSTTPGAIGVSHGPDARDPRLQHDHAESGLAATGRTTRSSCRSSAGSGTASRSGSTTSSASPIARTWRRGCSTPPTARSSCAADQAEADELLGNNNPQRAHHEGELRLGSAGLCSASGG